MIHFSLALQIFVVFYLSTVLAQSSNSKNSYINIGTSPSGHDVVNRGQIQDYWSSRKLSFSEFLPKFYFSLDNESIQRDRQSGAGYTFSIIPGVADSNIFSLTVDGQSRGTINDKGLVVSVSLTCNSAGHSSGFVNILLSGPNSSGEIIDWDPLSINFSKKCIFPLINLKALPTNPQNNNNDNNNNGQCAKGSSLIFRGEKNQSSFTVPGNDNGEGNNNNLFTSFCLFLDSPESPNSPSNNGYPVLLKVSGSNDQIINPSFNIPMDSNGNKNNELSLNINEALPNVKVYYNCLAGSNNNPNDPLPITLSIYLSWSTDPIKLTWNKICSPNSNSQQSNTIINSNPNNSNLNSFLRVALTNYNNNNNNNNIDVVKSGGSVGSWATNEGFHFNVDFNKPSFSIFLDSNDDSSLVVHISSKVNDNLFSMQILPVDTLTVTKSSRTFEFNFICKAPGLGQGVFYLEIANMDPISAHFTIQCRNLFNVQINDDPNNLFIKNGQLQGERKSLIPYTALSADVTSRLVFTLNPREARTKLRVNLYSEKSSLIEAKFYLQANDNDDNKNIDLLDSANFELTGSSSQSLIVYYHCLLPDAVSKISLTIDDGVLDSFSNVAPSPLSLNWEKVCGSGSASEKFSFEGGSAAANSGLGAFSILSITFFSLVIFACGLGCAYNFFHHERRGLDILPGRDYITSALNLGAEYVHEKRMKMSGHSASKGRGPQMINYDRVSMEEAEFGGDSYQADHL